MNDKFEPKYFSITRNLSKESLTTDFIKKLRPQQVIELARISPLRKDVLTELIKYLVTNNTKDSQFRPRQIAALVHCLPEMRAITAKISQEYQNVLSDCNNIHSAFFKMVELFLEGVDEYNRVKIDNIKLELFTRYSLFTDTIKADSVKGIPLNEIEQIEDILPLALTAPIAPTASEIARIRDLLESIHQRRQNDLFYLLSKDVNFAHSTLLKYSKALNIESKSAIK
ncbi:MAG: hypothetical protein WC222_09080 [Parachlamydiales bacterium]|jgi:hypothetical protein